MRNPPLQLVGVGLHQSGVGTSFEPVANQRVGGRPFSTYDSVMASGAGRPEV